MIFIVTLVECRRRNQEPSVSILSLYAITLIQRYSNISIVQDTYLSISSLNFNTVAITLAAYLEMPKIISSQKLFPDFIVGNTWGENNVKFLINN